MVFKIQEWIKKHKNRINREKFEDGYGWACVELLHHSKTVEEVESFITDVGDAFDVGACTALQDFKRIEMGGLKLKRAD